MKLDISLEILYFDQKKIFPTGNIKMVGYKDSEDFFVSEDDILFEERFNIKTKNSSTEEFLKTFASLKDFYLKNIEFLRKKYDVGETLLDNKFQELIFNVNGLYYRKAYLSANKTNPNKIYLTIYERSNMDILPISRNWFVEINRKYYRKFEKFSEYIEDYCLSQNTVNTFSEEEKRKIFFK